MHEIIIRVLAFSLLCLSALLYIYIYIIALTLPKIALAFDWEVLNFICSIHRKSHETTITSNGDHHQIPLVSFLRTSYSCCYFSSLSHSFFVRHRMISFPLKEYHVFNVFASFSFKCSHYGYFFSYNVRIWNWQTIMLAHFTLIMFRWFTYFLPYFQKKHISIYYI